MKMKKKMKINNLLYTALFYIGDKLEKERQLTIHLN